MIAVLDVLQHWGEEKTLKKKKTLSQKCDFVNSRTKNANTVFIFEDKSAGRDFSPQLLCITVIFVT